MNGIRTDIYLNGKLHGLRRWPAVPRIGDQMLVFNVPARSAWCKVLDVRWVDDGEGTLDHVDIFVIPTEATV